MKTKTLKRKMALVLALVISLGVLSAGCSNNSKTSTSGTVAVSGKNEFPITAEPVTLRIFAPKSIYMDDLATNEFTKWFEEKTGVKVEMDYVSGDTRQAINLKIASGDYGDIFMGFSFSKSEQMSYYKQGVFADMTQLVKDHGYYINEMLEENPGYEEEMKLGGKILGLPNATVDYSAVYSYVMWVYEPWLKKLNMDMPKTTDDFYEMLKAFRDNDLNGNGKKDEIPLAGRSLLGNPVGVDTYLLNAFGPYTTFGLWNDNGKAIFTSNTDEFKEGLIYMRKLYSEGLLHMDSFIMDRARIMSLAENETPILGAAPAKWTTQFTVAGSPTKRSEEYVAIAPLEGPNGTRQTLESISGLGLSAFNITSTCKYPEVAMKWIDWFYSKEAYLKTIAPIGTREAKDGELGLDGEQALFAVDTVESDLPANQLQNERWLSYTPSYSPIEYSVKTAYNTADKVRSQNAYKAYALYKPYGTNAAMVDFPVPDESAAEYLELRNAIATEVQSAIAAFVVGERSIENDWDDYVKRLEQLNVKRYVEIAQEYLDTLK